MPEPHISTGAFALRFTAARQALYVRYRQARRRFLITIRRPFLLDEDMIRDQVVDGLRRDVDGLTIALSESLKQDLKKTALLHNLSTRLAYYEEHIPRMRELRRQFEAEQVGIRKATNGEPNGDGILILPGAARVARE